MADDREQLLPHMDDSLNVVTDGNIRSIAPHLLPPSLVPFARPVLKRACLGFLSFCFLGFRNCLKAETLPTLKCSGGICDHHL